MRHFKELADLGPGGIERLLDAADRLLELRGQAAHPRPLQGKSVALVFQKASTRTRVSLEVAVAELGGHPLVITSSGSQLGRGEPIRDTARVLSRMAHAITFRTFSQAEFDEMARYSSVPVLNALTDDGHPMQILADLQTVRRHFSGAQGLQGSQGASARGTSAQGAAEPLPLTALRYCWLGDGNNVAASWIEAAGLLGLDLTLACPEGYEPSSEVLTKARERGGQVQLTRDPEAAARGAHVLVTDVFTSMGQEAEQAARLAAFEGYQLDARLLGLADPRAVVLHCLPAHRGEEISEEVLEGPQSLVWDEAEARLHTAKALLEWAFAP
ncbi:MAG: ornithine carbamoyltransferase [Polyangiaceae bacterium]|nr:ornithine carbamoyltransferase [Polyangiaceae bacterium]MCW5792484.1 ornithine carbamoyltransferase [Polyangiaceae bacterium]